MHGFGIGKGNEALAYLDRLFDSYLSVNTLYSESGPVIETPLSAAQSIQDMLLQSWGGKIRIFSAVPDAWQDVSYKNFRTEGAFLVTASRRKERTGFFSIKSLAGAPCVLETDIEQPVFKGKRKFEVKKLSEHTYQIDLHVNESVLVYAEETVPCLTVEPLAHIRANCYGKKK